MSHFNQFSVGAGLPAPRSTIIGKGTNGGSFELTSIQVGQVPKGGYLKVDGDETIGLDGHGQFTQSMGSHAVGGILFMGLNSGSLGEYTMNGAFSANGGAFES